MRYVLQGGRNKIIFFTYFKYKACPYYCPDSTKFSINLCEQTWQLIAVLHIQQLT